MLAAPLNKRGIAVITPDMPGAGAAIIHNNIKCGGKQIEAAFEGIYRFIKEHKKLDEKNIANFGLCMGGKHIRQAFRFVLMFISGLCIRMMFGFNVLY